MSTVQEIIRNDHKDLLSCVYEHVKYKKRDLNVAASYGDLHLAASVKDSSCLRYLLWEEKIPPNEICNLVDQTTPLHFAVM